MNLDPNHLLIVQSILTVLLAPALTQLAKAWPPVRDWATVVNGFLALLMHLGGWVLFSDRSLESLTLWLVAGLSAAKAGAMGYTAIHEGRK